MGVITRLSLKRSRAAAAVDQEDDNNISNAADALLVDHHRQKRLKKQPTAAPSDNDLSAASTWSLDPSPSSSDPQPAPLTAWNLAAHDQAEHDQQQQQLHQSLRDLHAHHHLDTMPPRANFPPPNKPPTTPKGKAKSTGTGRTGSSSPEKRSTTSSLDDNARILSMHGLHTDRHRQHPDYVKALVERIRRPRDSPNANEITPTSRWVSEVSDFVKKMKEGAATHALVDRITYRCKMSATDWEGEDMIYRGCNDQWTPGCVPLADISSAKVAQAMKALGLPPTPKPDFSFGYIDGVFEDDTELIAARDGLDKSCHVLKRNPWFCYQIIEWKCDGEMTKANQQAVRDGSALVNAMHLVTEGDDLLAPLTPVFSLSIDGKVAEIRIHWRNVLPSGNVAWEADRVESFLLAKERDCFDLRTMNLNILNWARTDRWEGIKEVLRSKCVNDTNGDDTLGDEAHADDALANDTHGNDTHLPTPSATNSTASQAPSAPSPATPKRQNKRRRVEEQEQPAALEEGGDGGNDT